MESGTAVMRGDMRERDGGAEAILGAVEFRVDVEREGDAVRVSPVGEVDAATIGRVREHINDAMATGVGRVVLDLRAITFLDSTALHLAVETHDSATRNGVEFAIIPGPPAVQRTFHVAQLTERLPFVDVPAGL
jgi:anti-sigma B factor antagonist